MVVKMDGSRVYGNGLAWLPIPTQDGWLLITSLVPVHPLRSLRLTCFVLSAFLLALVLFSLVGRYKRMQDKVRPRFPFLRLPQELRDMVYENLMEDPIYPAPVLSSRLSTSLWAMSSRTSSSSSSSSSTSSSFSTSSSSSAPLRQPHESVWIFAANKQIYREYMDMLCKKTTCRLTVSPRNFNPTSPQAHVRPEPDRLWNISPSTLGSLRAASLQLITTSAMLGVSDPRNMKSAEWVLARQIRKELMHLPYATHVTLDAKAIGDPLWNPLWIWYHASQSFKAMGTGSVGADPLGPRLHRITFSIDNWSPGENYLARDERNKGAWTWFCIKGHRVSPDPGTEMTVREFCVKLYQECKICRPESDEEEEEED